jgi:hypothetical protein
MTERRSRILPDNRRVSPRRMKFRPLRLIAAVLLAGSSISLAQTVQDPSAQCAKDQTANPEFSLLVDKLPVGDIRNITFGMLANDSIPTTEERNAIAAYFAANEQCAKLGESYRQANYPPEINNQLLAAMTAINLVGVDLYKGRITYGEANKRLAAVRDDLGSKMTVIIQQYKKDIAERQTQTAALKSQAESQRLQAASQESQAADQAQALRQQRVQMMFNYMRANPIQAPTVPNLQIRQPITSNCTMIGNQASCTSQ